MRRTLKRIASLMSFGMVAAQLALTQPDARAQVPGTESISTVFSIDQRIAGYDPSRRALRFFAYEAGTLREEKSISVDGSVSAVAAIPNGRAVATGMGREFPQAPAQVIVFMGSDSKGKVIFERSVERNQINAIMWREGKLWIDFFASKYITTIGYLTPSASGSWSFTETASLRMGDSLDVVGDLAVVGRSYGDIQGQDGDLLLLKGSERTLLPSYRGVRAVRIVGDPSNHRIFIGDGWHMNYGQLAQGRLSVVSKQPEEPRYSLQILDYDNATTDFRRLTPFRSAGKDYLAALGSSSVVIYDQLGVSPKKIVYQQSSQTGLMEMTILQVSPEKALVVVADQGLRIFEP